MPFCPFNGDAYPAGLPHLGRVETLTGAPFSMLKRQIAATKHADGLGAWRYVWADHAKLDAWPTASAISSR